MYEPDVAIVLMYGSHDMRHVGFCKLTVVNGTPGNWGVTSLIYLMYFLLIFVYLSKHV